MTLDQLCCTPEQSRKFAELGMFGDSVFVRWRDHGLHPWEILLRNEIPSYRLCEALPAATMQELGEWLWSWRCAAKNKQEKWGRDQKLHDLAPFGEDAEFLAAAILQIIEEQ